MFDNDLAEKAFRVWQDAHNVSLQNEYAAHVHTSKTVAPLSFDKFSLGRYTGNISKPVAR